MKSTMYTNCLISLKHPSVDIVDEGSHPMAHYSIIFIDKTTTANTRTSESTWKHPKASFNTYNRKTTYTLYLAKHVPKEMQGRKCSSILKIHTHYEKQIGAHQSSMKNTKTKSSKLSLSTYCDERNN
jgi:hypothetical protein